MLAEDTSIKIDTKISELDKKVTSGLAENNSATIDSLNELEQTIDNTKESLCKLINDTSLDYNTKLTNTRKILEELINNLKEQHIIELAELAENLQSADSKLNDDIKDFSEQVNKTFASLSLNIESLRNTDKKLDEADASLFNKI